MNRPRPAATIGLDALAVVTVGGLLLYLPLVDGGFLPAPTRWAGWILVAAAPVLIAGIRSIPTAGQILTALWGLGAVGAFAVALERTAFWRPLIVYALLPLTAMATMRIWRRTWGPPALLAFLLISFGLTWYEGFAAWYGTTLSESRSLAWRSLSFTHQSAAAMLAGGVTFSAVALTSSRPGVRLGTGLVAAAGLSGVWLSDSPWSPAAAAVGLIVVVLGTPPQIRVGLTRLAAVLAAAAALTVLLNASQSGAAGPDEQSTDLASIEISRVDHWEAALAMFADRPLTGRGPGSFATAGTRFADPGTDLTIAAVGEPFEALAEGGLVFGLPVLATLILLLGAGAAGPRSGYPDSPFRREMRLAGSAAAVALGAHCLIHFDWLFPLIAVYLAVAAGIVFGDRQTEAPSRPATMLFSVPVVTLIVIGLTAATIESRPANLPAEPTPLQLAEAAIPWNGPYARSLLTRLLLDGYATEARILAGRTIDWNPGYRGLATLDALAGYVAGAVDADAVRATFDQEHPDFATLNVAAEVFVRQGDLEQARAVAGNAIALLPSYEAADPIEPAMKAWMLWIDLTGRLEGCDTALSAVAAAAEDPIVGRPELVDALAATAGPYCP